MSMKLTNSTIGVALGIMYIAKDHTQWLYKQVGQERILYARFGSPQRAREFMQTLVDWDAAGGNDGGIEK